MYAFMKLEDEAPIYDGFGFVANFKKHIKAYLDSLLWNIKCDETHLILYSWKIGYLVNY